MKTQYKDLIRPLTSREIEIIQLINNECSTKEIAHQLYLSTETIKTHRSRIMTKLCVKSAVGIVKVAYQMGILQLESNARN